jgi:hypothetical protein
MSSDTPRVVSIDARLRHVGKPSRPAGLSEAERQVLLDEIAQIAGELNELQRRAAQIAGRVAKQQTTSGGPVAGRADRSA